MRVFNSISEFISTKHDQSRGNYILNELQGTYNALKRMDNRVANDILTRFHNYREMLLKQISHSKSELLQSGLKMQKDAKDLYEKDLIESYSRWLTGAWLESRERNSDASSEAYEFLNDMADYIDINDL